ncbi:DUF488 domain-containing protein [Halobaculum lipolyticum]|uniref:DUF488 domain-containing protein n=1 Tax=Halobaculum lipolyticum TaxID=3032001 RepID=A0ABD5WGT5_9EURY|nr:DUF488 domain-containing protein [Halobaculum sp. DT31]
MALFDTYVAALQRDRADIPEGTRLVGVVRRPTRWFHAAVDENRPALAPPAALLDDHADAAESFRIDGLCESGAHNAAWDRVDFERRYRDHLASDAEARAAVETLRAELAAGDDVALVCFENTDEKHCHRIVLRDAVTATDAVPTGSDDGDA